MNHKKTILVSMAASLVTLGLTLGALALYIQGNRQDILAYLAAPMIKSHQDTEIAPGQVGARTDLDSSAFLRAFGKEEDFVIAAVERSEPAVFSIVVEKDVPVVQQRYSDPFFDFFSDPFGFNRPQSQVPPSQTERRQVGSGSGFFVAASGLAVTNKHVVADANASYKVVLNDGKEYNAVIVAKDPVFDIAIIQVEGSDFAHLSFADSDALRLGQTAIAIGNALGEFSNSVSTGVVSGLSRSIVAGDNAGHAELLDEVIQTDAAINPGNSGGPLLNLDGKVIGMNVAVAGTAENIGFALPANLIKSVADSVAANGKIVRPYLGVRFTPITPALKQRNNVPVDYGVLVSPGTSTAEPAVVPGSPAAKAGIVANDIILEIDGKKLDTKNTLAPLIRRKSVGNTISIKLLRDGREMTLNATLEAMPE